MQPEARPPSGSEIDAPKRTAGRMAFAPTLTQTRSGDTTWKACVLHQRLIIMQLHPGQQSTPPSVDAIARHRARCSATCKKFGIPNNNSIYRKNWCVCEGLALSIGEGLDGRRQRKEPYKQGAAEPFLQLRTHCAAGVFAAVQIYDRSGMVY